MSNEELVQLYQQGDINVLEQLLKQNEKFIYQVSRKFFIGRDNALDKEDLIQEGRIGLMKAAEKYNPINEVLFISYAYYWIYQVMHRFMYPRRYMRENKDIRFNSLNVPISEGGENELGDLIKDETAAYQYDEVVDCIFYKEFLQQVNEAMDSIETITERDKEIIRLRHGLEGRKVCTYREIAEMYNICFERVKQMETNVYRKIRSTKWARLYILEKRETIKNKVYDLGEISLSFFDKLNFELENTSLEIEGIL